MNNQIGDKLNRTFSLIAENKIEEAIEVLSTALLSDVEKRILLLIKGDFSRLKKNFLYGVVSMEEYNVKENRLTVRLLETIKSAKNKISVDSNDVNKPIVTPSYVKPKLLIIRKDFSKSELVANLYLNNELNNSLKNDQRIILELEPKEYTINFSSQYTVRVTGNRSNSHRSGSRTITVSSDTKKIKIPENGGVIIFSYKKYGWLFIEERYDVEYIQY